MQKINFASRIENFFVSLLTRSLARSLYIHAISIVLLVEHFIMIEVEYYTTYLTKSKNEEAASKQASFLVCI